MRRRCRAVTVCAVELAFGGWAPHPPRKCVPGNAGSVFLRRRERVEQHQTRLAIDLAGASIAATCTPSLTAACRARYQARRPLVQATSVAHQQKRAENGGHRGSGDARVLPDGEAAVGRGVPDEELATLADDVARAPRPPTPGSGARRGRRSRTFEDRKGRLVEAALGGIAGGDPDTLRKVRAGRCLREVAGREDVVGHH